MKIKKQIKSKQTKNEKANKIETKNEKANKIKDKDLVEEEKQMADRKYGKSAFCLNI